MNAVDPNAVDPNAVDPNAVDQLPVDLVSRAAARRAAMLDDLAALVDQESPSREVALLRASADGLARMMERLLGRPATIVDGPNGPHVLWQGGGQPRVLLIGHHDTVFPVGTVAARPFAVDGSRATGPGVFDMKGGIVQALHALALLRDGGRDISHVEVLVTADEEIGSRSSRSLVEERALACGAVLVLEPSADGGVLKTGRKGTGNYEVHVHGRASHAGLEPEKGVNAIVEAAAQIQRIATMGRPEVGTTVTPTLMKAGTTDNVVPAEAWIMVDVRVVEPDEPARLDAAMAALSPTLAEARVEVTGGMNRPPMHPSASEALFPLAVAVAEALGLAPVTGTAVGGGSDGNFTAAVGVPTLDGLGAVGGGAHADHEWIDVDRMADRAALLAGLVASLAP